MKEIILYFAVIYFGNWEKIYDAIEKEKPIDEKQLSIIKEQYQNKYLTILDKDYPQQLKYLRNPPLILFFRGNLKLLKERNIIWPYGINFLSLQPSFLMPIIDSFNKNNIVSICGNQDYFENNYIKLRNVDNIIIVKTTGIDSFLFTNFQQENDLLEKNALIISEYPNRVIPGIDNWFFSNRIKIGLSKGIFLFNSIKNKQLFELLTQVIAAQKEIYCYLNKQNSASHNQILVNNGARPIKNIKELINE